MERLVSHRTDAESLPVGLPSIDGYAIEGFVGEGGMGRVYRARRLETQEVVALKVLKHSDGAGIYRMKREFRALTEIVHPNLVRLFELEQGLENCFFTMELVRGLSLFDYLGVRSVDDVISTTAGPNAPTEPSSGDRVVRPEIANQEGRLDLRLLRDVFRQLAEGVKAIHAAGKLHCDLKPSNILVEPNARVVVLDFGVSISLEQQRQAQNTVDGEIGGTPEYMSPEQSAGRAIGPASDWYAVGVILYEALCGRLPFTGSRFGLGRRKETESPPRPSSLAEGVPASLEELCMSLLVADPDQRANGDHVLAVMAEHGQTVHISTIAPRATDDADITRFFGREAELEQLWSALAEVSAAGPVLALILGSSGIGKSALVQRFLGELAREPQTIVLRGRCYERESVPYKGFDSIIDELSRVLRRLSDREVAELLPRDVGALSRIFPVLKRVPAIAVARGRSADPGDVVEVRRRAMRALKELLAGLSDRWRLVLCVDDAHWGDEDSAHLLSELLTPPDAPSLFALIVARADENSPIVRELVRGQRSSAFAPLLREIQLEELDVDAATELAQEALGDVPLELAALVAKGAGGNPFFLRELSLFASRQPSWRLEAADGGASTALLESMLLARLEVLTPTQRSALELVAVASRPVSQALVTRIIRELFSEAPNWHDLRDARLIQLIGSGDRRRIECYHDRVREAVLASLSTDAKQEYHRLLAAALEKSAAPDPEVLLEHFRGAGDLARARRHVVASATAAAEALAFARAARLYRLALELLPETEAAEFALERKLADVLASDGRLAEAALVYERGASRQEGTSAVELRRLAAQHYLTSGQRDAGERVLTEVLRQVGLSYPATPGAALARLAWGRLKLRVRGLQFVEQEAREPERQRMDVCFSAAVGFAMSDLLRTAVFSVEHLNLALKAGDPERIARGLAFEMGVAPGAGDEGLRWASRALPVAERLSETHGTDYHRGLFFLAQGHVAHLNGQWRASVEWLARAESLLRGSQTPDLHWALLSGHVLSSIAAVANGDLRGAEQRLPGLMNEARQRGELHRLALMAYPAVMLELAHDRPARATALLAEFAQEDALDRFDLRDFTQLHCSLLIDRYTGHEDSTWPRIERAWPRMERSKLLVVNTVRVAALAERGSAALAELERGGPTRLRRVAQRSARQLEKERLLHARPLGGLLRARLERIAGNLPRVVALLTETSLALDSSGLALHADCTRRVAAELMGGSMGDLLIAEADRRLRAQGVENPRRFAAMMVPGFDQGRPALLVDRNG